MGLEKLKAFKTLAGVKGKFRIVDVILFISILCYKFISRPLAFGFRSLAPGYKFFTNVARIDLANRQLPEASRL